VDAKQLFAKIEGAEAWLLSKGCVPAEQPAIGDAPVTVHKMES
jgi:hypothetical protein